MSENKFTPGPWMAVKIQARWNGHKPLFPDGTWHIVPVNNPERISICETCQGDDTDAETRQIAEYDARLIAEAPNLLKALQNFVEPYNGFSDEELARRVDIATYRRIIEAQDAIRKATEG